MVSARTRFTRVDEEGVIENFGGCSPVESRPSKVLQILWVTTGTKRTG
ncbi:hypothetical protein [Desulfoscipio gibsoniae]|uniref:Uncharacterized protein n=1 Tax=Desulfoscipio gibsoniae DSM 7213 TaxID=767817 RepID=R4KAF4_9FIRM|nr:hypothetical protein [Desulfoscipio gibsoniae]AGL00168.1 hypothetical protein Desgi_0608 [Desulfoscipio gibsoniae DSM 7213]